MQDYSNVFHKNQHTTASWQGSNSNNVWQRLHIDLPMLIGIIVVCSIGLLILYSAKPDIAILQRQILRLLIAAGLMLTVAQLSPRSLQHWTWGIYILALLMLLAVLFSGHVSNGAQRWLDLGFMRFQPAELMKLAVPLAVANYFSDKVLPPDVTDLIIPFSLIALPAALIAMQPDLGTAVIVASSGLLVVFFAGISWSCILLLLAAGITCAPLLWYCMHTYQRQRVLTFLNPESDPLGSGYHIIQSKIAIGSGGLNGKGWLNGSQSNLDYLPERSTDFIFAVFSEEFGLLGVLFLLGAYLFLIIRGLIIATRAQDTFSRLLAGGLTMTIFVYIFINIGMVTGVLPVVGIPLPLISYGGTSLVTLMVSFGIIMGIYTHKTLVRK